MEQIVKKLMENRLKEGTAYKRIASTDEFDNGHVIHNDWAKMSDEEAEKLAKEKSIKYPNKTFYVQYDDIMNPSSDIKWKDGESINEDSDMDTAREEFFKACTANPTWKKANSICEKYGYKLADESCVDVYPSGRKVPSVSIRVDREKRYNPEVYYYHGKFGKLDPHFEIQTTAYGSLNLEEYSEFIDSVTKARDMVESLSKIDFTTLYEYPVED